MPFRFRREDREVSVKNVVLTIIFWALTLAWILLIFLLSSIPVTEVANLTDLFSFTLSGSKSINVYSSDRALLSTIGHVLEFSLLTFFSYMAISSTNKISVQTSYAESPMKILKSDNEMNIIFTLWFSILNAIFDEYHQLFVEGHTGGVIDLCKDIIGIVVVLLLIRIFFTISLKLRGKNEIRYT
jgi:VanZ family protein